LLQMKSITKKNFKEIKQCKFFFLQSLFYSSSNLEIPAKIKNQSIFLYYNIILMSHTLSQTIKLTICQKKHCCIHLNI
jgi:hypothetical protein